MFFSTTIRAYALTVSTRWSRVPNCCLTTDLIDTCQEMPAGQWLYNYAVEGINNPAPPPVPYFGHTEGLMAFAVGGSIPPGGLGNNPSSYRGLLSRPGTPFTGWYH